MGGPINGRGVHSLFEDAVPSQVVRHVSREEVRMSLGQDQVGHVARDLEPVA